MSCMVLRDGELVLNIVLDQILGLTHFYVSCFYSCVKYYVGTTESDHPISLV